MKYSQILLIYYFSIYEVRFNAQIVDSKLSNRKIKYSFVWCKINNLPLVRLIILQLED